MNWFSSLISSLFGGATAVSQSAPALTPTAALLPGLSAALAAVSPNLDWTVWGGPLQTALTHFGMATPKRIAAAMGQFLVEAGPAFANTEEDLNYTSASRLLAVYPSHFADEAAASVYINNPQALANYVYANMLGNGPTASGDGWLFRGRGLIQITGRTAYERFAADIGMSLADVPGYCETPAGAAMSGCWYLSTVNFNQLADAWEISAITRAVNGNAMLGAAQRLAYSNDILERLAGNA